jgi:diguanylate cyclase (GGDEF)-like protein
MFTPTAILSKGLDVVAFSTACLVGVWLLQAFCHRRRRSGRFPLWMWCTVGIVLALSALFCQTTTRAERKRLGATLTGLAPTYAEDFRRAGHSRINVKTDPADETYLTLIDMQRRWLACDQQVSDIYTVGRDAEGKAVLLVDSETDYDHDGKIDGDVEKRTTIGEAFEDDDGRLAAAFDGEVVFDPEPATDRWGTWVSAYAPIRDEDGKVHAVLGVDYSVDAWAAATLRQRGAVMGLGGLCITILVGLMTTLQLIQTETDRLRNVEQTLLRTQSQLRSAATFDALTGLPNRALFLDRLTQALIRSRRHAEYRFAVLLLGFDQVKVVNDGLGHGAGDELLKIMSQRLVASLRANDTVALSLDDGGNMTARIGGDEFVILLDFLENAPSGAAVVAARLIKALSEPYSINGYLIHCAPSIGITCADGGDTSADEILRHAHSAMSHARKLGGAQHVLFNAGLHKDALERVTIENDLRAALANSQQDFMLDFQPIVHLNDGRLAGFEALIRWEHPRLGRLSPARFIDIAEDTGLIIPLGERILRDVCMALKRWDAAVPAGSAAGLTVNVNISQRQIESPDFVSSVERIFRDTGTLPQRIKLEITETVMMHNPEVTQHVLQQLRNLGVQLLVDDFGTGYSSLGSLHRFSLDGLKIDRSFVAAAISERHHAAVIKAIVALADNLQLTLVAEGIETAEQVAMLQALDCKMAQGYYFSRPIPQEQVMAYLSAVDLSQAA